MSDIDQYEEIATPEAANELPAGSVLLMLGTVSAQRIESGVWVLAGHEGYFKALPESVLPARLVYRGGDEWLARFDEQVRTS